MLDLVYLKRFIHVFFPFFPSYTCLKRSESIYKNITSLAFCTDIFFYSELEGFWFPPYPTIRPAHMVKTSPLSRTNLRRWQTSPFKIIKISVCCSEAVCSSGASAYEAVVICNHRNQLVIADSIIYHFLISSPAAILVLKSELVTGLLLITSINENLPCTFPGSSRCAVFFFFIFFTNIISS